MTSFFLGGIIGLYLNYVSRGNIILILGIVGVFLGFFYTAYPLRIGYTGLGEFAAGVGFGPLVVLGSYYVQAQRFSFNPLLASVPLAVLIALVLYINEFPDYQADKIVGKKTLVVILGKKRAIKVYFLLLIFPYLFIIFGLSRRIFPFFSLLTLLTLPLSFRAVRIAKENFDKVYALLPANALTIKLHSLIGLILSGGYLLDRLL